MPIGSMVAPVRHVVGDASRSSDRWDSAAHPLLAANAAATTNARLRCVPVMCNIGVPDLRRTFVLKITTG